MKSSNRAHDLGWNGVFPALTTQFHADLSLDLDGTAKHIEAMIASGVKGLIMMGSLGENLALSREEKREVFKMTLDVAAGRLPVLSGVAEVNTWDAVAWVGEIEAMGGSGVMVLPAMVYRADPHESIAHYQMVARSTKLPIIAYNNPIAYHIDITPEMFEILGHEENIVGIKESCGDTRRITDLINHLGDRYVIFAGVDDLIFESVALGATAWIAGIGLAFPEENQRLWELMIAGNWNEALTLYRWFSPLAHLDVGNKFIQKIKLAIKEVGLGSEYVRMPRLGLTGAEREETLRVIHHGIENRPRLS